MSNKEKIKEEIERLSDEYPMSRGLLKHLTKFIDSLPEEHTGGGTIKENYNERYKRIAQTEQFKKSYCDKSLGKEESASEDLDYLVISLEETIGTSPHSREVIKEHLQKAAEWQKQQMKEVLQTEYEKGRFDMREEMMKDAVECDVVKNGNKSDCLIWRDDTAFERIISKLNNGDKVKIIIVKEEQQ